MTQAVNRPNSPVANLINTLRYQNMTLQSIFFVFSVQYNSRVVNYYRRLFLGSTPDDVKFTIVSAVARINNTYKISDSIVKKKYKRSIFYLKLLV